MTGHPMLPSVPPSRLFTFRGAAGERLFVFPCPMHSSHVVVGFGQNGVASCLHLDVREAGELADVLRAGPSWAGLSAAKPAIVGHPETEGDRQCVVLVNDGMWSITVRGELFVVTMVPRGMPTVMAHISVDGRAKVAAAIGEVLYGKTAAA